MTSTTASRWRWAAPLGAAALVVAGSVAVDSRAEADPGLPPRSAEDLLTMAMQARVDGLSGTVSQSAELGLPDLGQLDGGGHHGGGDASPESLLTGSHTLRVWQSGPDKARVSLPSGADETTVVRNGDTAWLWSSDDRVATRFTRPEGGHDRSPADPEHRAMTPQQAAQQLLAAVEEHSRITTASNTSVAGRPAYEIVVTPTQQSTKVDRVEVAIDGETGVPLEVELYARDIAAPALEVGFSQVSFGPQDDSLFTFTPPPGATVEDGRTGHGERGKPGRGDRAGEGAAPVRVGTGWETVTVVTGPARAEEVPEGMLEQLPRVSGSWGSGRLLDGTAFSAVVADDGRVAFGAVPADELYAALG